MSSTPPGVVNEISRDCAGMGRYTLILFGAWGVFALVQSIEPELRAHVSGLLALAIAVYATRTLRRPAGAVVAGKGSQAA